MDVGSEKPDVEILKINLSHMDKKLIMKYISVALYAIGIILVGLIIVSWFVEYPDWLSRLLTNIMLVGLGLVLLYQALKIRKRDRKYSFVYLVIGVTLIIVALASFTFIKIIAVAGLVFFLLTRPFIKKEINKNEPQA
ncbi:MAG TPA: hypothetical protein DC042_00275 [Bacteroidales bacterium]|nr:hypothetical protein [Bacteroidales bacterium]